MEGKYHFVKIAPVNKSTNGLWYFKPHSIEQVVEHFNKIFGKEISAGIHDKMSAGWAKHPDTAWRYAVDAICHVKGYGWDCHGLTWIEEATKLENTVLQGRIKDFTSGVDFYLANGVQEFILWDRYEIVEEYYSDELEFPLIEQFHFEDVRYMKWDLPDMKIKGVHWYAKIGNEDIRDKDGNMKWNTKEEAEEAARWFCQEMNWKHYHNRK